MAGDTTRETEHGRTASDHGEGISSRFASDSCHPGIRWTEIFASTPLALAVNDAPAEHLLYATPAYAALHGYTPDELIGRRVVDLYAPDARDSLRSVLGRAASERAVTFRSVHIRKDGSTFPARVDARAMTSDVGEILYWITTVEDLSTSDTTAQAQAYLAAIVESSEDAIIGMTLEGDITSWNAAAERLFGYTAAEIVGRSILTILPPELQHEEAQILGLIGRGEKVEHIETVRVRKDGRRVRVSMTVSPLRDATGRVVGASKILRDVTALRETEAAERLLQTARTRLVHSFDVQAIVHELAQLAIETLADGCLITLRDDAAEARGEYPFVHAEVASRVPGRAELVLEMEQLYPLPPDSPSGYPRAIRTGEPELVPHGAFEANVLPSVAHDARHLEMLRELEMHSGIVAPLVARGHTLGAMTLVRHGPEHRPPFTERDVQVAEELGRRAGLAIDNARLYAEVRETAGRIARLQAVTAGLARAITVEQVAETVVREGIAAFGATDGILAVMSEHGEALDLLHSVGIDEQARAIYRSLPLDADLPMPRAVRARRIITVESRAELGAEYTMGRELNARLRADSWLVVPLQAEERTLGCMAFGFRGRHISDADERALATAFAQQCVVALERARLYEAEQEARAAAHAAQDRAEFLAEASHLLASSLDYEQTLRTLARAAVPRLGDWCAVDMLADPLSEEWPPTIRRLAVMQNPARVQWAHELEQRFPTDWNAPTGLPHVLRDSVTEFYPNITEEMLVAAARSPEELAMLQAIDFHAFLCVPLVVRGRAVGAITLAMTESGRTYADADRTLAENLAQRAALAIEHAMLFREAQEANRVKAEFLAVMSHELRTPLNAIGGHVQLLDMGLHGPVTEAQREALGRVSRSQERLLGLINDILNYARLESGRVEFDFTSVLVADVVGEVASLLGPQMADRKLTLDVHFPEDTGATPIPVVADREKLTQVVLNLFSNAVKFTPPGGRITVELVPDVKDPMLARLRVSDTGLGIPADKLHVVFEPFVQVGRGLTSTREGTGLGLAISRDLARGMGGDLTAESTVGAGSTFTLTLQRA